MLRGLALVNDLAVLRSLFGAAALEELGRRLSPDQRALYEAGFEPSRWYEEDIQVRLTRMLEERLDDAGLFAFGVAVARHNVNTAQRFLARIAGPAILLRRGVAVWRYWRNQGEVSIEENREGVARVLVRYPLMAQTPYATCYGGACAYLTSLGGAAHVRMRVDVVPGVEAMFHLRWSPEPALEPGYFALANGLAQLASWKTAR
jgi:hypothetical protein